MSENFIVCFIIISFREYIPQLNQIKWLNKSAAPFDVHYSSTLYYDILYNFLPNEIAIKTGISMSTLMLPKI